MFVVALTSGDCLRAIRAAASCSFPVLALAERHVVDFAEAGSVMVQRSDMAPVHRFWAVAEVVGAVRRQARKQRVDLCLGGDEGVQRGIVGLRHDGPRVGFEDMTALVCPVVKFNRAWNVPRTSDHFRVAWVLHGGIGTRRKGLESLGNVLCGVATQKAPLGAPCIGLSL